MKIRKFSTLVDDVYKISLYTEDWSQGDQDLMANFGEPEVDIGGDFTGPPAFTLSTNLARIMSESPFTQSFDGRDFADAEDRAVVWKDEVSALIVAAVAVLRALDDEFTGEEVENV